MPGRDEGQWQQICQPGSQPRAALGQLQEKPGLCPGAHPGVLEQGLAPEPCQSWSQPPCTGRGTARLKSAAC